MLRLLLLLSIGVAAVLAIAVLLSVACLAISTGLLWLLVGVLLLVAGLAVIIVVVLFQRRQNVSGRSVQTWQADAREGSMRRVTGRLFG